VRTIDNIKTIVRAIPLEERLLACCDRIGRMARETKGPRMSIPVEPGDDDIFITTTLEDAREELAKAHQSVVELNQRLIERQESFQAQLIRIEDTWRRELAKFQAQVLALREALGKCTFKDWFDSDQTGEVVVSLDAAKVRAALSSPPPPVVKLEDVRPLVVAITSLTNLIICPDDHREENPCRYCDGKANAEELLKTFLTTYPQLNS